MESKKRIFLSHASQDNAAARVLVSALEQGGFEVWYDEKNLGYGPLRDALEQALRSAQVFAVLLSHAALASIWVNREIDAALELEKQQPGFLILPLLIEEGCQVPLLLSRYRWLDCTGEKFEAALQNMLRVLRNEQGEWLLPPLPAAPPAQAPTNITNNKTGNIRAETVYINQAGTGGTIHSTISHTPAARPGTDALLKASVLRNELKQLLKEQAGGNPEAGSAQGAWPVSPERTARLLEMMLALRPHAGELPEPLLEDIRSLCRQADIVPLI